MTASGWTVAPVLPVADVVRSVAWYERLGFAAVATYDGYAILACQGAELHLREVDEPAADAESASGAYLRVTDADATFAHWSAMGAPALSPPTDQPYGVREFATEDPDGNLLRVGSWLLDEAEPEPEPAPTPERSPVELVTAADLGLEPDEPASDEPPCPGCGWRLGGLPARALGAEARDVVHAFGELLRAADDDAIRVRPGPGTWSALEYGVHVRDVLTTYADRIVRTLTQDTPDLVAWDQEEPIADGMANESDREAVADDLGRNASHLSAALRMVGDEDWTRRANLGHPDGATEPVTLEDLARRALHECVHHLADARAALADR